MDALQLTRMMQEQRRQSRLTYGIFAVVLGLSMLGLQVDFAPVAALRGSPMAFAMWVLGLGGTIALKRSSERRGLWDAQGKVKRLYFLTLMPFLTMALAWLIFAKAIPWAYTLALGAPYRELHTMQAHYSKSRYGCEHRLRGGPLETSFPDFVCISPGLYARHPEQDVEVEVWGRRSVLGTQVEQVRGLD